MELQEFYSAEGGGLVYNKKLWHRAKCIVFHLKFLKWWIILRMNSRTKLPFRVNITWCVVIIRNCLRGPLMLSLRMLRRLAIGTVCSLLLLDPTFPSQALHHSFFWKASACWRYGNLVNYERKKQVASALETCAWKLCVWFILMDKLTSSFIFRFPLWNFVGPKLALM